MRIGSKDGGTLSSYFKGGTRNDRSKDTKDSDELGLADLENPLLGNEH